MSRTEDVIGFLVMSSFWALNYPLVKIALLYEDPYYLLVFRVLFAAVFSLAIMHSKIRIPDGWRGQAKVAVLGMLNIVLFMEFWFAGEATETSSLSSIIIYTYPILATLLAIPVLGERVSGTRGLGAALGLAGVVLIFVDHLVVHASAGLYFLIIGALSWAFGTVYYRKYLSKYDPIAVNTMQFVYALPVTAVVAAFTGPFSLGGFGWQFIGITVYMGSLGTFVAYLIYLRLYRKYSVSAISSYFFLVPALSIVFGYAILHETISAISAAGFVLIGIGIFLTSRGSGARVRGTAAGATK
ncbi:EamA family transporter [Thermogymnomonas acidicola]|uniref:EamA family transporter n=1 Tax=Thermogymnomonas acidicola TaxID=399579 RepID=A0AA37BQ37_9ARCH|nr:DMT family transporter [Thermogymnomonas acidicola]GGM68319.1 EamA family transporter [Thermogymnomonas acidicola]